MKNVIDYMAERIDSIHNRHFVTCIDITKMYMMPSVN